MANGCHRLRDVNVRISVSFINIYSTEINLFILLNGNLAKLIYLKFIYLNFQSLEVESRYRDPQPQVIESNSYLFNLRPNIYKS